MYRLLVLRIIAGLGGGIIAHRKGRARLIWALLCAFFPPLIIVVLLLPPQLAPGRTKRCPYCSRIGYRDDAQCRYCKRQLPIDLVQCHMCGSFVPDKGYCTNCHKKLRD